MRFFTLVEMENMIDSSKLVANRVDALTGLRIFATLAIVLHHLPGQLWLQKGAFSGIPLNQGVSFFFVLSGFILQHSYRRRLGFDGVVTPMQFVALRFIRLWPCHIAVITLLVIVNGSNEVLNFFQSTLSTGQILAAIFLLQAWHPDSHVVFALNGPAWSISVEMFFYLIFPFLCQQAIKSPLRPICFAAGITGAWLAAIWLYMPTGDLQILVGVNPLARTFEFAVGIASCEYFSQSKKRFNSGTYLEFGVLALVVLTVSSTYFVANFIGLKMGAQLGWWFGYCGSFGAFALLISVVFRQEGIVSRFMALTPITYLGEISFALYLVHQPVITYLAKSAPWFHPLPLLVQGIVFTIVVFGLSSALHHFIEKPCMTVGKMLTLRR